MLTMTWNVQWCRGCDGVVDPARIARTARELADFDVLCLQEVARNFPDLEGSHGEDQFRLLAEALPGYTLIEGVATDRLAADGTRRQFGNAIFTRLPALQVFRHLLPWPSDDAVSSMQRVALETVLATGRGALRVTTTHLEYYSATQRMAQVGRLRGLQAEAASHAGDASRKQGESRQDGGPFVAEPRPASGILTADFNFRPDQPEYLLLQLPIEGSPRYRDAWAVKHGDAPHAPTVGVHDARQWPGRPFCFDMMFVTEDLVPRVEDILVDATTDASDHQPMILRLAD